MSSSSEERDLFTPVQLGPYELRNRLVMAPMTRSRAGEGNLVTELTFYGGDARGCTDYPTLEELAAR